MEKYKKQLDQKVHLHLSVDRSFNSKINFRTIFLTMSNLEVH